jgi:hypothetical protein
MHATRPSRYTIEWDSQTKYAQLRRRAEADGTFSDNHEDWYDPTDIAEEMDAGDDLAQARLAAREVATTMAHYNQARISERVGIYQEGLFWDCREVREIETIEAYDLP